MIRSNLATRPFYNERAVHVWLLVVALVVLAATLFNVSRILRYSHSDTELATAASRDEARAADLRRQASSLRATVDPHQVELTSNEARQANELIDRRTFSWTQLLNEFETTLPEDVRITSVRPKIDRRQGTIITVSVVARTTDDVNQFMENMTATGVFTGVRPLEEHPDEQGMIEALLETGYPFAPPAPPAEKRR